MSQPSRPRSSSRAPGLLCSPFSGNENAGGMPVRGRRTVLLRIQRWSGRSQDEPYWETHQVVCSDGASVSGVLDLVNEQTGAGIAHYVSCRRGLCSGCVARINGEVRKACIEPVQDELTVEAAKPRATVRDIVYRFGSSPDLRTRSQFRYRTDNQDRAPSK